jgi:hypothetical protein
MYYDPGIGGAGGLGGGANGGENLVNGDSGYSNTGGGGGGSGGSAASSRTGGTGGSGIVILKYPDTKTLSIPGGLTASTTSAGGYKITTFTAGTGTVTL